ncbi:MAG: hypothetical protein QNJ91_16225 [Gammaproteobacteria bacterium]|nr:hypothetical protein [Gammaproteobacteria bacterium]
MVAFRVAIDDAGRQQAQVASAPSPHAVEYVADGGVPTGDRAGNVEFDGEAAVGDVDLNTWIVNRYSTNRRGDSLSGLADGGRNRTDTCVSRSAAVRFVALSWGSFRVKLSLPESPHVPRIGDTRTRLAAVERDDS